jgi:hypothetical protein
LTTPPAPGVRKSKAQTRGQGRTSKRQKNKQDSPRTSRPLNNSLESTNNTRNEYWDQRSPQQGFNPPGFSYSSGTRFSPPAVISSPVAFPTLSSSPPHATAHVASPTQRSSSYSHDQQLPPFPSRNGMDTSQTPRYNAGQPGGYTSRIEDGVGDSIVVGENTYNNSPQDVRSRYMMATSDVVWRAQ